MSATEARTALLLLAPEPGDEFWRDATQAADAARRQIERLRPALDGLEIVLATTPPLAAALEGSADRVVIAADCPAGSETAPWLAPGSGEALRSVSEAGAVLLADLRCLDLTADDVAALRRNWAERPEEPHVLADTPRHNPCQLERHFCTRALGYAVLFDAGEQGGQRPGTLCTRPFALPSPTLAPEQDAATFWDLAALLDGAPRPEPDPDRALDEGRSVCRYREDGKAVALLPAGALPPLPEPQAQCLGLTLAGNAPAAVVYGLDSARGSGIFFRLLEPLRAQGASLNLHLSLNGESLDLPYRPDGPCELPALPDTPGIPYALLDEVGQGAFDVTLGVQQERGLWRRDGQLLVRADTSTVIHGRQAYPDCVRLAPALCMGRRELLLAPANAAPAALHAGRELRRVRSLVDWLRLDMNGDLSPAEDNRTEEVLHATC